MKHEESKIQQACVKWFRLQYPKHVLFAIPNGGWRSYSEASIMRGEGVVPGVADLFLAQPVINKYGSMIHGLFIEMKTKKGRQSEAQKRFEIRVSGCGYKYAICRSVDEFMNVINEYLR